MIKNISCKLTSLVSGGDGECSCYAHKSLGGAEVFVRNILLNREIRPTPHIILNIKSWCYDEVCNRQISNEAWSMKCSFDADKESSKEESGERIERGAGAPCRINILGQYTLSGHDGII